MDHVTVINFIVSYANAVVDTGFHEGGSIIKSRAKFLRATPILIKTTPISARFGEDSICPTNQSICF